MEVQMYLFGINGLINVYVASFCQLVIELTKEMIFDVLTLVASQRTQKSSSVYKKRSSPTFIFPKP